MNLFSTFITTDLSDSKIAIIFVFALGKPRSLYISYLLLLEAQTGLYRIPTVDFKNFLVLDNAKFQVSWPRSNPRVSWWIFWAKCLCQCLTPSPCSLVNVWETGKSETVRIRNRLGKTTFRKFLINSRFSYSYKHSKSRKPASGQERARWAKVHADPIFSAFWVFHLEH